MNEKNYEVLINIIGAVESGGQIYGKRRYNAYADPFTNSPKEYTITLGAFQSYGAEANELLNMIYAASPNEFAKVDTDGSLKAMLSKDWVAMRWKPNATQKAHIIKLIDSEYGHIAQDKQFRVNRLEKYIARAEAFGVNDVKAQMMWAEIQHLGGVTPTARIFKRCNGDYSLDSIMASLKKDQSDSSSNNQVGDKVYWSRHVKCREFIKQYAENEGSEISVGYDVQKLIDVATAEIGYCEKASNKDLDSKTANAGRNNYTKYWRDMKPGYQAQAWCDCFVDWCFTKAYGAKAAQELECGGCGEFYTPTSAQYYKNKGQWSNTPKIGSQIFFRNSERICHTGIVVAVGNGTVTTIEGNTSNGAAIIPNGGMVCKKTYSLDNSRIAGYGHPNYGKAISTTNTSTGGKIMIGVEQVKNGSKGASVLLLQEILRVRGFKGENGKVLSLDGDCGTNTVYAINAYQTARRKQGVELGTNKKNDGCCGNKMWDDLTGGLVVK